MTNYIQAILLDMDGVLYHGEKAIADAVEFMAAIAHLPHAFITNNPIKTPDEIADRLQRLGFVRPDETQIVTSAQATALWLGQQKKNFRYFAVGGAGLHQALAEVGTPCSEAADFVVIGEGEGIDFATITTGVNLILKHGARLICTNPDHSVDAYIDGQHRVLPGGGALVAPFAIAAEVEPVFIGKPHALLYQMALQRLGMTAQQCLMIGDRPDTDIAGAAALGMRTALVRTGRFLPGAALPTHLPAPDWDVDSLKTLQAMLVLA
ncbi:MAG: HAD-IIA family hydrolase [Gammaproteobacteria bacterium]|nr:HAD-IIA family hydrolase [Gammaproteobacteria bacterium]